MARDTEPSFKGATESTRISRVTRTHSVAPCCSVALIRGLIRVVPRLSRSVLKDRARGRTAPAAADLDLALQRERLLVAHDIEGELFAVFDAVHAATQFGGILYGGAVDRRDHVSGLHANPGCKRLLLHAHDQNTSLRPEVITELVGQRVHGDPQLVRAQPEKRVHLWRKRWGRRRATGGPQLVEDPPAVGIEDPE